MDKRFITFLMLSMLLISGYMLVRQVLYPPPKQQQQAAQNDNEGDQPAADNPDGADHADGAENGDAAEPPAADAAEPSAQPPDTGETPDENPPADGDDGPPRPSVEQQWISRGSVDPKDGYQLLVTFNNLGGTVQRVELASPKYRDLEDGHGYFGHLALTNVAGRGARVNVVGRGTPAAGAKCIAGGADDGLRGRDEKSESEKRASGDPASGDSGEQPYLGDVIVEIDGAPLEANDAGDYAADAQRRLHAGLPGEDMTVTVERDVDGKTKTLTFRAKLIDPPMQVIKPDPMAYFPTGTPVPADAAMQPQSFLTTLSTLGDRSQENGQVKGVFGREELKGLPSLHNSKWEVVTDPNKPDEVAFRFVLTAEEVRGIAGAQPVEVIKRYRLAKDAEDDQADDDQASGYHLTMTVEVKNLGKSPTTVALEQRGPTGLPLEGWWYVRKGSPDFGSAGMRDVTWRSDDSSKLYRLAVIFDNEMKRREGSDDKKDTDTRLFSKDDGGNIPQMEHVGVDGPYFSAVMLPDEDAPSFSPEKFRYAFGEALITGDMEKKLKRTAGTSFRLITKNQSLQPEETYQQQYTLFVGPKDPKVLQHYGLQDTIIFGWEFFGAIARILLVVLHWIYAVVRNYGVAIILLTVLVRMLVLPIGRKQAQNAAKMQELAPEMKALSEKYKDMEQRAKAQQELFRRHNYHPLGGCWMMFLQLPIFYGLYKSLSTSIDLRQAPLIPGLSWCSNLAGPDMLWRWDKFIPFPFLTAESGFLGPYLNILPLITITLFIVQQKLFTPPATDENQRMQQGMMKYMMIFMGFLFFKVPSGLCLYFIVSALWSIAERKLLPKAKPKNSGAGPQKSDTPAKDKKSRTPAKSKPRPKPKTKAELKENSLAAMFNRILSKPEESNGKDGNGTRRSKRKRRRKKKEPRPQAKNQDRTDGNQPGADD